LAFKIRRFALPPLSLEPILNPPLSETMPLKGLDEAGAAVGALNSDAEKFDDVVKPVPAPNPFVACVVGAFNEFPNMKLGVATGGAEVDPKLNDPAGEATGGAEVDPKLNNPVGGATGGAEVDPKLNDPVGGASGAVVDPKLNSPVGGATGAVVDPKLNNPVGGATGAVVDPKLKVPVGAALESPKVDLATDSVFALDTTANLSTASDVNLLDGREGTCEDPNESLLKDGTAPKKNPLVAEAVPDPDCAPKIDVTPPFPESVPAECDTFDGADAGVADPTFGTEEPKMDGAVILGPAAGAAAGTPK
jgi:hypothetical protein